MKPDTETTKVIFRADRKSGEVTALFPALAGTNDPWTCLCYAHLGQHGSASVDYVRATRPAKPAEYASLKRELTGIGYRLRIGHRINHADYEARLAQVR